MNCIPHDDAHTEECIKGISPCDGFRCSICGAMLPGDLQGNPNPCMCHECADSYTGAAYRDMDAVRSSIHYSETDERTQIGNYPTCDECNEQHSQDVDCSDWTERLMTAPHPALIPEIPASIETIDITPVGCQTPEGVKRVSDAQQEWDSATHLLANTLKEIMDDDEKPTTDDIQQLRALIGARDRKQEAFLRAVAGK